MRGYVQKRGKASWRIRFDIEPDPITGERRQQALTVKGTKKMAEAELTRQLQLVEERSYVERSALTVVEYARHWLSAIAPAQASRKTLERYGELIERHIAPNIGDVQMQKLDGMRLDAFYAHLLSAGRLDGNGGLSPQTITHIHRLLSQIFKSAVKAKRVRMSPMVDVQARPKVRKEEVQVLEDDELAELLRHVRSSSINVPVMLAASTGMRRGEVLGLRWSDINFDRGELSVAQVIEQTAAGIAFKEPKTDRSRRTITLPGRMVQELRAARVAQNELRLKLGLGRSNNDLVFTDIEGLPINPRNFSKAFAHHAEACGLGHVTFHGLRHTHITHLLRSGVPVHVVSARAGHANPSVTLNIYAHLLAGQDSTAAAIVDSALRAALQD